MNLTDAYDDYKKVIDENYVWYRGEVIERKEKVWHWRSQPFEDLLYAKKAIDKAMIQKAEPKGRIEINWRKAI